MLYNIYFSAKGTTQKCADYVSSIIKSYDLNQKASAVRVALAATNDGYNIVSHNLLNTDFNEKLELAAGDTLLLSMPVYGGFIPSHCINMIKLIKGDNTPAIILAIFGNRHFDNALIQMKDLVEANGFKVIAAGAFLAEHSIFPTVAHGRPDTKDFLCMEEFAKRCRTILDYNKWQDKILTVPGMNGSDPSTFKGVPFHPDADDKCTDCQKCVNICPMKAINPDSPKITDGEKCISCGACISVCPVKARDYHSEMYEKAKMGFELKCGERKEPFTYYIQEEINSPLTSVISFLKGAIV